MIMKRIGLPFRILSSVCQQALSATSELIPLPSKSGTVVDKLHSYYLGVISEATPHAIHAIAPCATAMNGSTVSHLCKYLLVRCIT
jgi:hypothetical protein